MKPVYYIKRELYAAAIADVCQFDPEAYPNIYVITRINVMSKYRGQGLGSQILRQIIADADAEGTTLHIYPAASGGLTQKQLEQFYKRYGFVMLASVMERKPSNGNSTESN